MAIRTSALSIMRPAYFHRLLCMQQMKFETVARTPRATMSSHTPQVEVTRRMIDDAISFDEQQKIKKIMSRTDVRVNIEAAADVAAKAIQSAMPQKYTLEEARSISMAFLKSLTGDYQVQEDEQEFDMYENYNPMRVRAITGIILASIAAVYSFVYFTDIARYFRLPGASDKTFSPEKKSKLSEAQGLALSTLLWLSLIYHRHRVNRTVTRLSSIGETVFFQTYTLFGNQQVSHFGRALVRMPTQQTTPGAYKVLFGDHSYLIPKNGRFSHPDAWRRLFGIKVNVDQS